MTPHQQIAIDLAHKTYIDLKAVLKRNMALLEAAGVPKFAIMTATTGPVFVLAKELSEFLPDLAKTVAEAKLDQ